jgi:hypothetical protein
MSSEVSEAVKEEIFKLISTPGIEIEEISDKVNLDIETVMNILSEEYFKCNLDHGRRLCCR